jgi:hypothetical protein
MLIRFVDDDKEDYEIFREALKSYRAKDHQENQHTFHRLLNIDAPKYFRRTAEKGCNLHDAKATHSKKLPDNSRSNHPGYRSSD